ncbi:MAG: hypothetical protein KJP02_05695 [Octadecabacter sp.]|nr:hypothetical protein [Octadecabacter sp.]
MPRLENKKHELYAYARVYHKLGKMDAVEFAGYARYAMNYARIEKMPEYDERVKEMQSTPKEELYADEEFFNVPADHELVIQKGDTQIINYMWMINQLRLNMEASRAEGKYRESNEAIKLMAGLMELEERKSEAMDEVAQRRARQIGIKLNAPAGNTIEAPKEHSRVDILAGGSGDSSQAEPEVEIISPGDVDKSDADD